jgi:zinc D-Ala-D-Ala carboxypeptidase
VRWQVRAGGAALLIVLAAVLTACTGAQPAPPRTATSRVAALPTRSTAPPTSATAPPTTGSPGPSHDDPTSLQVIVDKLRPLHPRGFVPPDLVRVPVPHTNPPLLRRAAAAALVRLVRAADTARVRLLSISAYRSFASQQRVYGEDLRRFGRAGADRQTARPGYSEHQTGLAVDLGARSGRCALAACLGSMPEGRWIATHDWRFGFVLRYPKGAEAVTGYEYEPWHLRYVGSGLAARIHRAGDPPLETFFGLPAAPRYA